MPIIPFSNLTNVPFTSNLTSTPFLFDMSSTPFSSKLTSILFPYNLSSIPFSSLLTSILYPSNVRSIPFSSNLTSIPFSSNCWCPTTYEWVVICYKTLSTSCIWFNCWGFQTQQPYSKTDFSSAFLHFSFMRLGQWEMLCFKNAITLFAFFQIPFFCSFH